MGIIGRSPALLADGINSTSDVIYGLAVSIFMRLSHKPADQEHPFGHSQFESIAALTVGAFVITTGVGIFWDSASTIYDQVTGKTTLFPASSAALWVALFTIMIKIGLFLFTRRIGQAQKSVAVTALDYDHRNDIFSATAAFIGITLGRAGYPWVDPLAAALVALVILRTGFQILANRFRIDGYRTRERTGKTGNGSFELGSRDPESRIHLCPSFWPTASDQFDNWRRWGDERQRRRPNRHNCGESTTSCDRFSTYRAHPLPSSIIGSGFLYLLI
jgi:hypothetical protein